MANHLDYFDLVPSTTVMPRVEVPIYTPPQQLGNNYVDTTPSRKLIKNNLDRVNNQINSWKKTVESNQRAIQNAMDTLAKLEAYAEELEKDLKKLGSK